MSIRADSIAWGPDPGRVRDQSSLARELKRLRDQADRVGRAGGSSVSALARATGLSRSSLYAYLAGTHTPRPEVLDRIVQALGVDARGQAQWAEALDRVRAAPTSAAPGHGAPAQLPPLTGFVGRAAELDSAGRHLGLAELGQAPVLIVSGAAGVGKTALAIRVGRSVRHAFPDGQLFVNLRGGSTNVMQPSSVVAGFLISLGVSQPPESVEDQIALYRSITADRAILVVLDDAPDEASARTLLPAGERCATVITSRSRLPGLDGATRLHLGMLTTGEALELFAAEAGVDRVAGDPRTAQLIVDRCARLPLAVRIAGARLAGRATWSLERLLTRLADDHTLLDTLSVGDRAIRATLTEAVSALPDEARRAFLLLGSLPVPDVAGWLAAAVLDRTTADAEDQLDTLIDAHLLDAAVDAHGGVRYRFHDLLRAYALEQLSTPVDGRAHACRIALRATRIVGAQLPHRFTTPALTSAAGAEVRLPELTAFSAQTWFDAEIEGLLNLVHHAGRTSGLEQVCWQLACALDSYLESSRNLDGWRSAQDAAFAAASRIGDTEGMASALHGLGELHLNLDDITSARGCLLRARELLGDQDRRRDAHLIRALAYCHLLRGENASAINDYTAALAVFDDLDDVFGQADAAWGLGAVHLREQQFDDARRNLGVALRAYERLDDRLNFCSTSLTLATLEMDQANLDDARAHLLRGLAVARALRHDELIAAGTARLGEIYRRQGRHRRAGALLRSACKAAEHGDSRFVLCDALRWLGLTERDGGDTAAAIELITRARDLSLAMANPLQAGAACNDLGDTYLALGRTDRAYEAWREAIAAFGATSPARAASVEAKLAALAAGGAAVARPGCP